MMGRAEMQMLRTGDLAGGGGERRALNLFPPTHTLGNVLGPPVAWRKLSPRQAGNRYRAQAVGDSGPPGLPRCSGLHPAPAAGKVAPAAVQTISGQSSRSSGVSIGKSKATGPSPSGDALFAVPPCMGSGVTWYPRDSHTLRPLPRQP